MSLRATTDVRTLALILCAVSWVWFGWMWLQSGDEQARVWKAA